MLEEVTNLERRNGGKHGKERDSSILKVHHMGKDGEAIE
jgi:hypothetical protein